MVRFRPHTRDRQYQRQQEQNNGQQQSWRRPMQRRNPMSWVAPLLKFAMIAAGVMVVYINIQPYIEIVKIVFAALTDNSLLSFIMTWPVIGNILRWLGDIGAPLVAIPLWAILQMFELLPLFLKRNQDALSDLIAAMERFTPVVIKDTDSDLLAKLKHDFNTRPVRLLRNATIAAGVIYVIDLALCCFVYPPLKPGVSLPLFLSAPSLGDVDVKNVLLILVTAFGVELLVIGSTFLRELVDTFGIGVRRVS